MNAVWLVALAAYRETVRDRVPLSIAGFGVLLVCVSYLISQVTAGQDLKIIKDLGLAALHVLGLIIAVFIGVGLVTKEVERRSVYNLLSKPVSREQFVLGKYFGLVTTLAVNLGAMVAAFYAVLFVQQLAASPSERAVWPVPAMDPRLLIAVALIFAELALVTALTMLLSTFATPLVTIVIALGLWVAGHFNADLRAFDAVVDSPAATWLARGLYYLLPNLAPFNVKAEVVHGVPVAMSHVGLTLGYAVVYTSLLLLGAMAIFRHKDLK